MSDYTPKSPSSSSTSTEAVKETLKEDASTVKAYAEEEAKQFGQRAEAEADEALTQAGSEIDGLTQAIDAAADSLSESDREGLAQYARQLSEQLSSFAADLQKKSASDLAHDAQKLAKENPTGFLLGSIALGFGLSRFAKASSARAGASHAEPHTQDHSMNGSAHHVDETSTTASSSVPPARTPL